MRRFGGPEVLQCEHVAAPEAGPDEVLVAVEAVSVNNLDLRLRAGTYHRRPSLPHVLGWDPAGTVLQVGRAVTSVAAGDKVVFKGRIRCGTCAACGCGRPADCTRGQQLGLDRWGGYAEQLCVPAGNLRTFPANLSPAEASVVFRHFPQAFSLVDHAAAVRPGEWFLVMGAAGALGSCLVQVGKLRGATVIAGAGSAERAAACIANGADFAIDYRDGDLAAEVLRVTGGHGADVVAENIGDPTLWPGAMASLARSGRLVTVGAHAGGRVEIDLNQLYMKDQRIIGTAGSRPRDIDSTVAAATDGTIRAVIGAVVPLCEAAEAHRLAEQRAVAGKVILAP